MNSKCKVTRHRCSANKKCYRKSLWTRKNLIKRCKVGTRKCRDNKCHKKKANSAKHSSAKNNLIKYQEPIKTITNNMVQKIASNISNAVSARKISSKKRPVWRY